MYRFYLILIFVIFCKSISAISYQSQILTDPIYQDDELILDTTFVDKSINYNQIVSLNNQFYCFVGLNNSWWRYSDEHVINNQIFQKTSVEQQIGASSGCRNNKIGLKLFIQHGWITNQNLEFDNDFINLIYLKTFAAGLDYKFYQFKNKLIFLAGLLLYSIDTNFYFRQLESNQLISSASTNSIALELETIYLVSSNLYISMQYERNLNNNSFIQETFSFTIGIYSRFPSWKALIPKI